METEYSIKLQQLEQLDLMLKENQEFEKDQAQKSDLLILEAIQNNHCLIAF